jgi:hypothetical protein
MVIDIRTDQPPGQHNAVMNLVYFLSQAVEDDKRRSGQYGDPTPRIIKNPFGSYKRGRDYALKVGLVATPEEFDDAISNAKYEGTWPPKTGIEAVLEILSRYEHGIIGKVFPKTPTQ